MSEQFIPDWVQLSLWLIFSIGAGNFCTGLIFIAMVMHAVGEDAWSNNPEYEIWQGRYRVSVLMARTGFGVAAVAATVMVLLAVN
jgi:hypothetical protein